MNRDGELLIIKNGNVLLVGGVLKVCDVLIKEGRIKEIGTNLQSGSQIYVEGSYVLPGLIDIHTHGIGSESFDSGNLKEYARIEALSGCTTFFPGFGGPPEKIVQQMERHRIETNELEDLPQVGGFRLEGPYLACTGAALPEDIATISQETTRRLMAAGGGHIKIWDISPELPWACDLIEELSGSGIICSIAHTGAMIEQARAAVDAGATLITHMFNVFPVPERAEAGVHPVGLTDYLLTEDRLTCEIIADGTHVAPLLVEKAFRCKTPERIAFVTDSDFGAGLPPGTYTRTDSGRDIVVKGSNDGIRQADRGMQLAGSALTPIDGFRNTIRLFHKDIATASQICSKTPAHVMRLNKGEIAVGKDADVIVLDDNFEIMYTIVAGVIVYQRSEGELQCQKKR